MPPVFKSSKIRARNAHAVLRYDFGMDLLAPAEAPAAPPLRDRAAIRRSIQVESRAYLRELGRPGRPRTTRSKRNIAQYAALQGTLAKGADELLAALKLARRHRPAHL